MSLNICRFRLLLLTTWVMGLAACSPVGPDYVRPSAHVPLRYKEAQPPAQSGTASLPETGKWWSIYQDPVLDKLVSQVGASYNQSLAAALARVSEAQQMLKAAGSASLPSLSAGTFRSGRKGRFDLGLTANWEIDLWGRIRRDVEAHRAAAEASADDLAAATLSMQAQLAQSYFALRENDALIALLQPIAEVDQQWARMLRNQQAQGVASSTEVVAALARASSVQAQLADARTARAQFEHAIAVMLGRAPAEFSLAPAPFDIQVPLIPAGLPSSLLKRRPDIAASERRMASASARIGVSKAATLPSLTLSAGLGVRKGLHFLPNIEAPLFTHGRMQSQVDNARAAYAEAVANYRQTVLEALREVEDDLVAEDQLARTASSQSDAAQLAQESLRIVHNQYLAGVADYPSWVDANVAALNASQADLQLRLRRLNTSVNLIKALGGSWQTGTGQPAQGSASARRAQPQANAAGPSRAMSRAGAN